MMVPTYHGADRTTKARRAAGDTLSLYRMRAGICVLLPVALLGHACVRPAASFECTTSDQCTGGGICQPAGVCSFADADCPSGQRYGAASGDLSGSCVDGTDRTICDLAKPFGTPVPVAGVTGSGVQDGDLRLSPDEKTAYFFSDRTGALLLFTAQRTGPTAKFDTPSALANVNAGNQYNPAISADGRTLFFASFRSTSNDIYQATRASAGDAFTNVRLVPGVNSAESEVQPYVARDGATMYFVRELAIGKTVFSAAGSLGAGYANPQPVLELDGPTNDDDPVISADGMTLYWGSDRPGGAGDVDVWRATRTSTSAAFGDLAPVASVNSSAQDSPSDISSDGCRLYLTSNRDGRVGIYVATRPP